MKVIVVEMIGCPASLQQPLLDALLAHGMVMSGGEKPAELILAWLDPRDAGSAERIAAVRYGERQILPAVVVVGQEDSIAAIDAAAAAGADGYVAGDEPERLAAVALLTAQAAERFSQVSPLTGLPGNNALQREIERRLPERGQLAVLGFDVDNFKQYNDRYGYQRGDELLRYLQAVLLRALGERAGQDSFAAHVGGDDFVALVHPSQAEAVARRAIELFAAEIPALYDEEDATKGFIEVRTRQGEVRETPLASLTVAAVTNEPEDLVHAGQLAAVLAELKAYGKSLPGSNYVPDRRRNHSFLTER
ncbi:MAG: GGDEF domain-containing protein [Armatimonadota bacterium]